MPSSSPCRPTIYEYGCHEGSGAVGHFLSAERAYEREAAEHAKKGLPPPERVFERVNGADRGRWRARLGRPVRDNTQVPHDQRVSVRPMTIRRFASAAEADRHEAAYWQALPVAERIASVWQLSLEQWQLGGGQRYEPGLHRSVASLRRR
jgi:hypothetical protein